MNLFSLKLLLLLLFFIGCCAGRDVLPEGPVEARCREFVTLRTQVQPRNVMIIWNYRVLDRKEQVHVATLDSSGLQVSELYEGRASINSTNGDLTLGPLKMDDSGFYIITIVMEDFSVIPGKIQLRVLSCNILPEGPVEEHLGKNVTLKTLLDKLNYAFITWNYSDGKEQVPVATMGPQGQKLNTPYEGRASINPTNGSLTLGPLKMEDSGVYTITIIAPDGTVESAETQLLVLTPPETTEQPPGCVVALIVCAVVIVVLLAGYPLLYKWMKNKKSRPSNGRNVELSANSSAY